MADIQLPGPNLLQGYDVGARGSMGAAAAPWQALGGLGAQVQDLGERQADTLNRLQRVKNVKMATDLSLKMDEEFAAFQREMATNPNPEEWPDQWSKRLDAFKKGNLPDGLSPEQQAMLGERYAGFASKSLMDVQGKATMQGIGQTKMALGNRIEQSVRLGDPSAGMQAIQDGKDAGLWSEPEAEALTMDFEQKMEIASIEDGLEMDPLNTAEMLGEKNEDGTWAHFANLDPNQRARLQGNAKIQQRQVMGVAVEDAQNGMADGSISTPEQLERRIGGVVPARVMEQLKGELAKRWDAKEIALRATPEYQSETVGKVSAMLDGFTVEANDYDEKFVEMDSLVRSLPEGSAVKAELSRRLGQVRTGQFQEIESVADIARTNFTEAYKAEFFGKTKQSQSLRTALDDGFLMNPANLTKGGFTEEQAKKITGAETEKERMDLFRTLHRERTGKSSLTPYQREIYRAIRDGKGPTTTIEWEAPEEVKTSQRQLGEATSKFEKWLKANPDKANDEAAVNAKVYQIVAPFGVDSFMKTIIPQMPIIDLPPLPPSTSAADDEFQLPSGPGYFDTSLLPDR